MPLPNYPLYYKWVHPKYPEVPIILLVKMQHFATARFWDRKKQRWGPVEPADLAEQIDYGETTGGVAYEQITEDDAAFIIATTDKGLS